MNKTKPAYSADNFRENLRELMWEQELRQKDIAEMVGVPPSSVNNWLNSRSEPTLYNFTLLCEALNVTPEWMLKKNKFVRFDD